MLETKRRQKSELTRAIWDGRKAFIAGVSIDDCPYPFIKDDLLSHDSLLHARWMLGWLTEYCQVSKD
jgi:ribosome modulation factor